MHELDATERWTIEDDDFLRGVLLTLRVDVDASPLTDPEGARARGDFRRRRMLGLTAGIAAAITIIATLGFRGIAHEDASPPPLPATPPTLSLTPAPLPSGANKGIARPTPSPGEILSCLAVEYGPPDTSGIPSKIADTARALHGQAGCESKGAVVARFERDATVVSFGGAAVADALALPEHHERHHLLRALLETRPSYDEGLARWPALPESDADWNLLITSGILTSEDAAAMRASGQGYTGWRVVIADDGRVTAFVTGD
ncbi:hypothetical protein JNB_17748 [Janibacter sp. HTCC2649]|uniref:hypothetical protein n=1 Tax=Janibacter sp. HTCC2649 TaxID=313589 RepID=UPI0000671008|nr:hypothetical protein [Janibacter sp. HTCC2649]EAP97338.1 hypothetical protein JNB_17748 [Janibacter sp. HTCC2649]